MSAIGGNPGFYPIEEVIVAYADNSPREKMEMQRIADSVTEFTEDGRIVEWMKLPAGVPEEQVKAAIDAGQFEGAEDGYVYKTKSEWKQEDGKFFYDTKISGVVMGEKQSSWTELTEDADGLIVYNAGMARIKKI